MCTAVTYRTKDFYFGRTLDYDCSFGEEVTITPRNFKFLFRDQAAVDHHYALIGMAHVADNYPLYYDAVNEKGLAAAGLNFVGYAAYKDVITGRDNIAHFELIPWILGQCATVTETKQLLAKLNISDKCFSSAYSPAQLHWIFSDKVQSVTVEAVRDGIRVYDNPVGVLTNNPSFPEQIFHLNNYMHLSAKPPENRFSDQLRLEAYSRGMGAMGLPGDLSSQSRFVRAAFVMLNSVSGSNEAHSVGQFFHILDAVSQPQGCCVIAPGKYERTIYSSCCNTDKGIYYYSTYENRQITAVNLHHENLEGDALMRYPLQRQEQIRLEN